MCVPKKIASEEEIERARNTATHVHINSTVDYTAQSIIFSYTKKKTLASSAVFPSFVLPPEYEKSMAVWGNSTIGIIAYWIHVGRQQLGRGRASRTSLINLPVLDVEKLNLKQIKMLNNAFDMMCKQKLMRIKYLYKDSVRMAIDQAVLNVLGISVDLEDIRHRFCKEPHMLKGKSDRGLI